MTFTDFPSHPLEFRKTFERPRLDPNPLLQLCLHRGLVPQPLGLVPVLQLHHDDQGVAGGVDVLLEGLSTGIDVVAF